MADMKSRYKVVGVFLIALGIVSVIKCTMMLQKYMFYGNCLSNVLKNPIFSQNGVIYDFEWVFTALSFIRMSQKLQVLRGFLKG